MTPDTAVVTGAARGLGRAVATLFADRGAHVVVCDRDGDAVESVAEEIEGGGGTATPIRADVRDEFDVERLMETAARDGQASGIDCVVTAADVHHGDSSGPSLASESYSAFDDTLRTNTRGVFATIREAVPHLTDGARVLVPSSSVARAAAGRGAYGVSKAGAEAVALGFAAELDQVVGVLDVGTDGRRAVEGEADTATADLARFVWWAAADAEVDTVDGEIVAFSIWQDRDG